MDKLNNWSFRVKKAWIYGLFRVKTTLAQRFLSSAVVDYPVSGVIPLNDLSVNSLQRRFFKGDLNE